MFPGDKFFKSKLYKELNALIASKAKGSYEERLLKRLVVSRRSLKVCLDHSRRESAEQYRALELLLRFNRKKIQTICDQASRDLFYEKYPDENKES